MRLICIIAFTIFSCACTAQSFQVMTWNIRFDNPSDSVNAWPNRKEKVFALLHKYNPDILGVQEALQHQITDITSALGYSFVGVGRDDGDSKGEYSAVLFRKEKFDLLDNGTFWLSEQPEVPGSKNWDAAITRIATWASLMDKRTGRKFMVMNTHFDHIGKEAREKSAQLLKEKALQLNPELLPVIITGDFNCTRDEMPYEIMTDGELIELIDPASQPEGTYCTFKVNGDACRAIDYIFLTNEWQADRYRVITDHDGRYYPSDHLPVMLTLSLTE
jgi:endonuclease/exonuclease/phosphatase family metal-dependent hydrolase